MSDYIHEPGHDMMNEIERLEERIAELEDKLFALGAMEKPPCFCCGYNGSGYYNSKMHPCAKRHHELKEKDDE